MTIKEFHAWLDGFSEAIEDAPTPDQWAKVLAKLKQVRGDAPVFTAPTMPQRWYPSPSGPFVTCGVDTNMDEGTRVTGASHVRSL